MIKYNQIMVLATAALLLLAGCAKETSREAGKSLPMRVVPALAGETRASLTTADMQEFYLQVKSANPKYGFFGKFTKSGSDWSSENQPYWESRAASVSCSAAFFSGHDFTEQEFTDGTALAVPADQSTEAALKSADLLTLSPKTVKYTDTDNGALPVNMSHGLAKVNFVLSLGKNYYTMNIGRAGNPVAEFMVKDINLGFTFKPGTVTVKTGTKDNIIPFASSYTPSTSANKTATATYEAILVPQSFAAGELGVSFKIADAKFIWTNTSTITIESGKTYNLPLSATHPIVN